MRSRAGPHYRDLGKRDENFPYELPIPAVSNARAYVIHPGRWDENCHMNGEIEMFLFVLKALINSNNPNMLIQLYKSENYLTRNGQARHRHKF